MKSAYFPDDSHSLIDTVEDNDIHVDTDFKKNRGSKLDFPLARQVLWNRHRLGGILYMRSIDVLPALYIHADTSRSLVSEVYATKSSSSQLHATLNWTDSVHNEYKGYWSDQIVYPTKFLFKLSLPDSSLTTNFNTPVDNSILTIPISLKESTHLMDTSFDTSNTSNLIQNLLKCIISSKQYSLKSCIRIRAIGITHAHQNSHSESPVITMRFEAILPSNSFVVQCIQPLPILNTPLYMSTCKAFDIRPYHMTKLSGNVGDISAAYSPPTVGFLTLNQTRQVVFLLESDPALASIPIIGVWISITNIRVQRHSDGQIDYNTLLSHPLIWSICVRFLYASDSRGGVDKEIVFVDQKHSTFLLVVLTQDHISSQVSPIFFEVSPHSQDESEKPFSSSNSFVSFQCQDFTVDLTGHEEFEDESMQPILCRFRPLIRTEDIHTFHSAMNSALELAGFSTQPISHVRPSMQTPLPYSTSHLSQTSNHDAHWSTSMTQHQKIEKVAEQIGLEEPQAQLQKGRRYHQTKIPTVGDRASTLRTSVYIPPAPDSEICTPIPRAVSMLPSPTPINFCRSISTATTDSIPQPGHANTPVATETILYQPSRPKYTEQSTQTDIESEVEALQKLTTDLSRHLALVTLERDALLKQEEQRQRQLRLDLNYTEIPVVLPAKKPNLDSVSVDGLKDASGPVLPDSPKLDMRNVAASSDRSQRQVDKTMSQPTETTHSREGPFPETRASSEGQVAASRPADSAVEGMDKRYEVFIDGNSTATASRGYWTGLRTSSAMETTGDEDDDGEDLESIFRPMRVPSLSVGFAPPLQDSNGPLPSVQNIITPLTTLHVAPVTIRPFFLSPLTEEESESLLGIEEKYLPGCSTSY